MKRTFLRILPLAVAVLLATSCSKDENNDKEVVNNGQETVQTKTLPISITVNQKGLSKLSSANVTGEALQPIFETSDKLAIYNGETFLTELAIKEGSISQDGKSATFEGEITADGIVDGQTTLTATIGTQIEEPKTATSRENAVKQGCYQTAEFTYSSEDIEIQLEEQNAYIEVVWKNKGGERVDFTFGSTTVPLTLNDEGQGWIVVPAGTTFTCAALGLTTANTTAKGNIYGISRKFVPEGYVDLGIVDANGKDVYWAVSNTYKNKAWSELSDDEKDALPTKDDLVALANQCYWVWAQKDGQNGMYVFKAHDGFTSQNGPKNGFDNCEYSLENDPYIFLPSTYSDGRSFYWSQTYDTDPFSSGEIMGAFALFFNQNMVSVDEDNYFSVTSDVSVRLVR